MSWLKTALNGIAVELKSFAGQLTNIKETKLSKDAVES